MKTVKLSSGSVTLSCLVVVRTAICRSATAPRLAVSWASVTGLCNDTSMQALKQEFAAYLDERYPPEPQQLGVSCCAVRLACLQSHAKKLKLEADLRRRPGESRRCAVAAMDVGFPNRLRIAGAHGA